MALPGEARAATAPAWRGVAVGRGWEAPVLLGTTLGLLAFGLVALYSASSVLALRLGLPDHYFVVRQAAGALLGLTALAFFAHVDYRWLRLLAWPALAVSVLLLLLVVLPSTAAIAPVINGARRWLILGPLVVQPSEVAKLALLIWTAALAVKKQDRLPSLSRGLLPFLLVWGAVQLLIFLQPDLSSALLVLLLASLVIFAAGARIGHFLLLGLIVLPVVWTRVESAGYQLRRVVAFVDPGHDPAGIGYQISQSLVALGSGGLLGLGLGRGQQKFGFLPEPHNDFIFAMVGEEWGLLGTGSLLVLFAAFGLAGYRIARQAPDLFGFLLAIAMTNLVVTQALLHMAVNLAILPTTGLTLPFVSYGRSSLIVCLAAVGILLSVARIAAGARAGGAAPAEAGAGKRNRRRRERPMPKELL